MREQNGHWPVRLGQYLRDEPSGSLWRVQGYSSEARGEGEVYDDLYVTLTMQIPGDFEEPPKEMRLRLGKIVLYLHSGRLTIEETKNDPLTAEATLAEDEEWEDLPQD